MSVNDFVPEAGNRPARIEWVAETTRGETPSDPEWNTYSDHIENWWGWEPDATKEATQPHGEADPDFTDVGSETHEATIAYWMQQWFEDGSGNVLDASGAFIKLDDDNQYRQTHSAVSRMDISKNGADDAGYRVYHVGRGGAPQEVTVPFETDEGSPITLELSYQFEKFRTYRIDQPSSSTTLSIENQGTSSVDVTVENEGAGTAETITVGAGATETTTESYADIDAVDLSTDVDGDVIVSDGGGTTFTTIEGTNSRTAEGDLGVPALGSGSHASAINSDYVIFNDDEYSLAADDLAAEIISGELNVSLEGNDNSVSGTTRRNIHSEGRRATWSATVAGESESVRQVSRYLSNESVDIEWTADEGTVTGDNAEYFSPGESGFEAGNGKHQRDIELQSSGITLS